MEFDEVLDDAQAEPQAPSGAVEPLALLGEHFKHALKHLWDDADALVADTDSNDVAIALGADRDFCVQLAEFGRVTHQIRHDLSKSIGVPEDQEPIRGYVEFYGLHPTLQRWACHLDAS